MHFLRALARDDPALERDAAPYGRELAWSPVAERDILGPAMLKHFTANQFRCIRHASFPLTPIHAFIGPNDSGKSTLLTAVRTLSDLSVSRPSRAKYDASAVLTSSSGVYGPGSTGFWLEGRSARGSYRIWWGDDEGNPPREAVYDAAGVGLDGPSARGRHSSRQQTAEYRLILEEMGPAALLRLDPDQLKRPSQLVPTDAIDDYFSSRGHGLPGLYMSVLGAGDDSFQRIKDDFLEKFPTVSALKVRPVTRTEFVLEIVLKSGETVTAEHMSEGMLYYLAFAVLPHVSRTRILLVEEPENGLHPSRIADVMRLLRDLTESPQPTQVLIATHSPLVVNELRPDEVSVVTRTPEHGTRVTPIKETKNFEQRAGVYALGELWLSYADGELERELVAE